MSAQAAAGRSSHEPISTPSSAVAVNRSMTPSRGSSPVGVAGDRSSTGSWSAARASSRTTCGGRSGLARSANTAAAVRRDRHVAERGAARESRDACRRRGPPGRSRRRPSSSAVNTIAPPSGVQIGATGHRSSSLATTRVRRRCPGRRRRARRVSATFGERVHAARHRELAAVGREGRLPGPSDARPSVRDARASPGRSRRCRHRSSRSCSAATSWPRTGRRARCRTRARAAPRRSGRSGPRQHPGARRRRLGCRRRNSDPRAARGSDPSSGSDTTRTASPTTPASLRSFCRSPSASKSAAPGWSGARSTTVPASRATFMPADPAGRRQQQPGLAARRREVPQRDGRFVSVPLVVGLGVGIRARGREQQGPVGQERGVALTDRGAGQAARGGVAGRIQLPQRASATPCRPGRASRRPRRAATHRARAAGRRAAAGR